MTLQDLKAGDMVTIEIIQQSEVEEFSTKVIGSNETGVLLSTYVKDGVVFELNSKRLKDCSFNLYCLDATGERKCWKNVTIATISHKQISMYAIVVSNFGRYGVSGERRQTSRTLVEREGLVANLKAKEQHYVTVHDISDNGISFIASETINRVEGSLNVVLDDQIRGHYFRLDIPCQCVRRQKLDGQTIYGCKILSSDKRLLEYISLKRMELRQA